MKAELSIKLISYFAPNCPQKIVAPNCPTPNCPAPNCPDTICLGCTQSLWLCRGVTRQKYGGWIGGPLMVGIFLSIFRLLSQVRIHSDWEPMGVSRIPR